jgi:hypothetical protein
VLKHGVLLIGWPSEVQFVNPSQLSNSLEPLKKVCDALIDGTCKWKALSARERQERQEVYDAAIRGGTVQPRQRKKRSDAGKPRKKQGPQKTAETVQSDEEVSSDGAYSSASNHIGVLLNEHPDDDGDGAQNVGGANSTQTASENRRGPAPAANNANSAPEAAATSTGSPAPNASIDDVNSASTHGRGGTKRAHKPRHLNSLGVDDEQTIRIEAAKKRKAASGKENRPSKKVRA